MSKIALVAFHSPHLMQFLYKYTAILDERGIPYDVLYWERDPGAAESKPFSGRAVAYRRETGNYVPKYQKIAGFWGCLRFFRRQIRQGGYDRLVLLTTQTALPLYYFCKRVRKTPFVYDYRDLTYEHLPFGKPAIRRIIEKSRFTALSSEGFAKILGPSDKYVLSHNNSGLKDLRFRPKPQSGGPLRLTFWGMIRQTEWNKQICDLFGNDPDFSLTYHGEGYGDELREHCERKGYRNVRFTGRYAPDRIDDFAAETDVLINAYENDRRQAPARTVKLYDAVRYGLPMLVTAGSHMAELLRDNPAVYPFDPDRFDKAAFKDWYAKLDKNRYPYEAEHRQMLEDDAAFERAFARFLGV